MNKRRQMYNGETFVDGHLSKVDTLLPTAGAFKFAEKYTPHTLGVVIFE